jgi:hypothetical protein
MRNGMAMRKVDSAAIGRLARLALLAAVVSACGEIPITPERAPDKPGRGGQAPVYTDPAKRETIWGDSGFPLFGSGDKKGGQQDAAVGLGVNSFLWRATLDTISFMPVSSADPFGGVVITDWYSHTEAPNERFKLNVYILGRALRADGIRVAVFRQVQGDGGWRDAPVPEQTDLKIEDAILTRARQLRNETLKQ